MGRSPQPWSYTALDDFKNCPRSFYEKRVIKSVKEEDGEALIWGRSVHKSFEDFVSSEGRTKLPLDLAGHTEYLQRLLDRPGVPFCEQKIAFNKQAKPCHFFDRDVWCRGVIDFYKVHPSDGTAKVVDYKTGKPHSKFEQLAIFALWVFAMYPDVQLVNVEFYWTQTGTSTKKVWGRNEIRQLWAIFLPDLKQYAQAFKEDVWQARPSGLCNGWCPVTTCEHWKPKRSKR